MTSARCWATGDKVSITFHDRTVQGEVKLASGNGRSIFLAFEAILGGYVGQMPVFRDEDGRYRDLLTQNEVTLR